MLIERIPRFYGNIILYYIAITLSELNKINSYKLKYQFILIKRHSLTKIKLNFLINKNKMITKINLKKFIFSFNLSINLIN